MGEAEAIGHGKARALLEVVRLAFEEGIDIHESGHYSNSSGPSSTSASPKQSPSPKDSARLVSGGPCQHCACVSTPQWRRPKGTTKLLCNACGIFYTRYNRLPEQRVQQGVPHPPTEQPSQLVLLAQQCASQHKRKAAPQPLEPELLQCTEDAADLLAPSEVRYNLPPVSYSSSGQHSPRLQTQIIPAGPGAQLLRPGYLCLPAATSCGPASAAASLPRSPSPDALARTLTAIVRSGVPITIPQHSISTTAVSAHGHKRQQLLLMPGESSDTTNSNVSTDSHAGQEDDLDGIITTHSSPLSIHSLPLASAAAGQEGLTAAAAVTVSMGGDINIGPEALEQVALAAAAAQVVYIKPCVCRGPKQRFSSV